MKSLLTALTFTAIFGGTAYAEQLKVATTFTVIVDMARNVAGDDAEVTSITKPGAEIHGCEPTPGDLTMATGFIQTNSRVKQDTVLDVIMSGMFAVGLVLYVSIRSSLHLNHILFGNMMGVSPDELLLPSIIALVVTAAIAMKWRDLALISFDPVQTKVSGVPMKVLDYGLLAILSLTVVSMLSAVGIILCMSLLIAPGQSPLWSPGNCNA